MAEVDFLLASVSQVLEATSMIWGSELPANVNRVQGTERWRGVVGDKNGSEQ
jgi:hypothetical protein